MGIDNFDCLNSSLALFLFCNEPAKKIMVYVRLQLSLPFFPIRASTHLAGLSFPPPSVRNLWITSK